MVLQSWLFQNFNKVDNLLLDWSRKMGRKYKLPKSGMKEGISLRPQTLKGRQGNAVNNFLPNKFDNLDEMARFLGKKHLLSKVAQKEIENLNSPISMKKTGLII